MPYADPVRQRKATRDSVSRRRATRRAQILEGLVCSRCGFDDPRALEFHHRNAAEKLFNVMSGLSYAPDRLLAEIAKCDVICANCHAIEHDRFAGSEHRSDKSV